MKLLRVTPWWSDVRVGVSWSADPDEPMVQVDFGPLAVEIPVRWVPPDPGIKLHTGRWLGWNVYVCVDSNLWALGWHWSDDDRGVYVGPVNVQMETRPPLQS